MIFKQLFDENTWTYTYLLADSVNGKVLIIDPVLGKVEVYKQLIEELHLQLIYAIDTHVHADHITAIGKLRELYNCETVHGEMSKAAGITKTVKDNELIELDTLQLKTLYTPGHTDDSYCFLLQREREDLLFTGDTLLIRGTGRTDIQHGNAHQQHESLFNKLLRLDNNTVVYPGHDYQGMTSTTIGEEKKYNPRLQLTSQFEYVQLMSRLNLEKPKNFDIAVSANLNCGLF